MRAGEDLRFDDMGADGIAPSELRSAGDVGHCAVPARRRRAGRGRGGRTLYGRRAG
jgi:hypothetical protein